MSHSIGKFPRNNIPLLCFSIKMHPRRDICEKLFFAVVKSGNLGAVREVRSSLPGSCSSFRFSFDCPCPLSLKCLAVQASSYTSLIHLHCCLWSAPCSSSSCNSSDIQHRRRVPALEPQFSHVQLFSEQFSKTFKSRSGVSPFTSRWFLVWRSDLSHKSVPLVLLCFSAQVLRYVCMFTFVEYFRVHRFARFQSARCRCAQF